MCDLQQPLLLLYSRIIVRGSAVSQSVDEVRHSHLEYSSQPLSLLLVEWYRFNGNPAHSGGAMRDTQFSLYGNRKSLRNDDNDEGDDAHYNDDVDGGIVHHHVSFWCEVKRVGFSSCRVIYQILLGEY